MSSKSKTDTGKNRKTRSISRKINFHLFSELFSSFLLLNIITFVVAVVFWCSSVETAKNGFDISDAWRFTTVSELKRSILSADTGELQDIEQAYEEYESAEDNSFFMVFPVEFKDVLGASVHVYEGDDNADHYAYAGTFLLTLFSCLYSAAIIQLIILLSVIISGARNIRRHLAPLDDLAFRAQLLSDAASLDQQSLTELENAIDAISPGRDDVHISTGNAEMEKLEDSINHLLERMRESYSQQSRFVSDASHELRTPISVLQGYVDMLDRWGKDDEKVLAESISAIKSETEHMKKLVEQLLFLARGDSGRTRLTMENFSLSDMIREVCEESSMIDEQHTYTFRPYDSDIRITGDPSMLKQTARILADNAAKYTPSGAGITLSVLMTDDVTGSLSSAFSIEDEGMGIPPESVSHIFERFYRSDPARTSESGGTGLGLSVAKWIVDRHGGFFKVLTAEDIGTRIIVVLPQTV